MIYYFRKEMKKWHGVLWAVFAALPIGGLVGYLSYTKNSPSHIAIAKVNGNKITLLDFQKSYNEINSQISMYKNYAKQLGMSVDMLLAMAGLTDPKKGALDRCLNDSVLDTERDIYKIELDSNFVESKIAEQLPAYLKDSFGNVKLDDYKSYLARTGSTPAQFEERAEHSLERDLLNNFVQDTLYVPEAELKDVFKNNISKKKFNLIKFSLDDYLKKVSSESISKEELLNFYSQNKETYRIPEKRRADYWIINQDDYSKKIIIDESLVQSFYEKNRNSLFRIPPKVKVRHILFAVSADDSAEKIENTLTLAKDIRKQLELNGDLFAELANKHSDDIKTASKGGIIDFFDKETYEPEFEKAAFRLQEKGDLSDIIKTKNGFELIQLEQRISASSKKIDLVRDEIIKTLKAKRGLTNLQADLRRVIYESSKNISFVDRFIKENGLSRNQSKSLSKNDSQGSSILDLLANKLFTAKKSVGQFGFFKDGDGFVLYKVTSVEKSEIPSLKKVESVVLSDLRKKKAKTLLKVAVRAAKRDLLSKKVKINSIADSLGLELIKTRAIKKNEALDKLGLDPSFSQKAFILDSADQAIYYKNDSDYYLVTLNDVEKTSLISFADEKNQILQDEKNKNKVPFLEGFIASLLRNANIEIFEKYMGSTRVRN